MPPAASIAVIDAAPAHYDAIVAIERDAAPSSVVSLAGRAALEHAAERGHWLAVAVDDKDAVAGWIWFAMEIDRGGETAGQVFRIAVAPHARRRRIASALLEHARAVFLSRHAARIRITMAADDAGARAFFDAAGFIPGALTMERPL